MMDADPAGEDLKSFGIRREWTHDDRASALLLEPTENIDVGTTMIRYSHVVSSRDQV